jgi:hypothetical protein
MWSSVLVLALLGALNPLRLSLALLVISRPRPVPNLVAYWAGLLAASAPALLAPLIALHYTPMLSAFAQQFSSPTTRASATVRHVQFGMGALALTIAALMAARFWSGRRARLLTPAGVRDDFETPTAISRLLGRAQGDPADGTTVGSLLGRARRAWNDGSPWVASVLGLVSGPSADGVLYVLAIIVPSGARIGTQLSAAVVFLLGSFAVVELMLASCLAAPAKTQASVRVLHGWAQAHRRKIVIATFAVLGGSLIARGLGG